MFANIYETILYGKGIKPVNAVAITKSNKPFAQDLSTFTGGYDVTTFDHDDMRQLEKDVMHYIDAGERSIRVIKDKLIAQDKLPRNILRAQQMSFNTFRAFAEAIFAREKIQQKTVAQLTVDAINSGMTTDQIVDAGIASVTAERDVRIAMGLRKGKPRKSTYDAVQCYLNGDPPPKRRVRNLKPEHLKFAKVVDAYIAGMTPAEVLAKQISKSAPYVRNIYSILNGDVKKFMQQNFVNHVSEYYQSKIASKL